MSQTGGRTIRPASYYAGQDLNYYQHPSSSAAKFDPSPWDKTQLLHLNSSLDSAKAAVMGIGKNSEKQKHNCSAAGEPLLLRRSLVYGVLKLGGCLEVSRANASQNAL
ncbi:hypothetical protein CIPAW_01G066900 [Carya illinoinensis]|uniref:Uncharacterized protein n=1 Tax=Carya illinoinensis TaxID=32201 RepID=A0A8T1RIQ9_CARIL|nr:hypothetical protein CIPAW_01G066900 [Carya illinoinensis]